MVPVVAVVYLHGRGHLGAVLWKPPGEDKKRPVPDTNLYHIKDEAEALVQKNLDALPKRPVRMSEVKKEK